MKLYVYALYLLLPVTLACSPELMIYDAKQCAGAARSKGITTFKAYKKPVDKFPSGCSFQTTMGRRVAQFVPGKESPTDCSTTANPTPFTCLCKKLPEVRKTLVNKHRKK